MPILIRPSDELCNDFLSRPKTLACHFPTGWNFYFSLPIDVNWLHHMNPEELEFFSRFLWRKLEKITAKLGDSAFINVIQVQQAIESRRRAFEFLSQYEQQAWVEGYGVPVFDESQRLVDFIVDCESMEFDRQAGSSTDAPTCESEQVHRHPFGHNYDCTNDDETVILDLYCDGADAFEVRRNGASKFFGIYGGLFEDYAQWAYYRSTLWKSEIKLLEKGELQIANLPDGSWNLVKGPLARIRDHDKDAEKAPDVQDMSQNPARTPVQTEHLAPKATKYACPSCETDPGTSRTITPTPDDPQENSSTVTDDDAYTHYVEPRTKEDITSNEFVDSESDYSCFCTQWNLPLTIFGATFESYDEWMQFKRNLSEREIDLLYTDALRLSGNPEDGITVIQNPRVDYRFAHANVAATKRNDRKSASTKSPFPPSNLFRQDSSSGNTQSSHSAPTVAVAGLNPLYHPANRGHSRQASQQRQLPRYPFHYPPFLSSKDSAFSS